MSTTRELFGNGITIAGRRWFLDRYRRTDWSHGARWGTGYIREQPGNVRVGIDAYGPRHGLALFHTGAIETHAGTDG